MAAPRYRSRTATAGRNMAGAGGPWRAPRPQVPDNYKTILVNPQT
jgi:hypothetical protein